MIKDLDFEVDSIHIRGQLKLPEQAESAYPTVLLCHGVPSGIVDTNDGGYPLLAQTISNEGFAAYTFNFRGSGKSEGNFDVLGWTRDLQSALLTLLQQPEVDKKRIALVGFSAGAAVSIFVASQEKRGISDAQKLEDGKSAHNFFDFRNLLALLYSEGERGSSRICRLFRI